ncbi:hypothetical protein [Ottowia testudinis]|uniref:Uncharacterized protein n=1 Tax=Ottowia testudinis TaxID=2816950 RepID=A0A975CFH5_9BURK|nr:hypothetical protein [Ottowia testudinis]QTD44847.1 hypothetical protein J1M35_17610 [Ottowia testudinis]
MNDKGLIGHFPFSGHEVSRLKPGSPMAARFRRQTAFGRLENLFKTGRTVN